MSYKHRETNGTRNDSLNMENLVKNRERFFSSRRTHFIKSEMIVDCRKKMMIAIDGRDRTSFHESSL